MRLFSSSSVRRDALPDGKRRAFAMQASLICAAWMLAGCASKPTARTASKSSRRTYSNLNDDQASDIAIHAMGLVGTPYRYGGNTPAGGFDCSGLIGYVYRTRAGVAPPRTVAQLNGFGQQVDRDELRSGDLVLFGGSRPTHAGIYVGDGRFVHAPSTGGTVRLDQINSGYWAKQKMAFRRV